MSQAERSRTEEVLVPFKGPPELAAPVIRVRGTVFSSSLQMVREEGLYETYLDALPAEYHTAISSLIPTEWLSVELAYAHYQALDILNLPRERIIEIGRSVGDRVQGSYLGTLVRGARSLGTITPFTILERVDALLARVMEGGEVACFRMGEKDARIEFAGVSLARLEYFREGMNGIISAGLELTTRRVFVETRPGNYGPDSVSYRVSFV